MRSFRSPFRVNHHIKRPPGIPMRLEQETRSIKRRLLMLLIPFLLFLIVMIFLEIRHANFYPG